MDHDPAFAPKQLVNLEWEALRGRIAALEALLAEQLLGSFLRTEAENRESMIHNSLIAIENMFPDMTPIEQRFAVERAEHILKSAKATCEALEKQIGELGS